jgi:hypothetical protein
MQPIRVGHGNLRVALVVSPPAEAALAFAKDTETVAGATFRMPMSKPTQTLSTLQSPLDR